jgi:3-methyladenine DNA glycosylase AlkD
LVHSGIAQGCEALPPAILAEHGLPYLLLVADQLFRGEILEEKAFAVMLLEGTTQQFGRDEFKLFEMWIDRITSWADHDALVHYLIGAMVADDGAYLAWFPRWAKKKSVWHQRAAAVTLIHSTRRLKNFEHIQHITELLLASDDDMVQKGLGWLLREAAKANPKQTVAYLMTIRDRALAWCFARPARRFRRPPAGACWPSRESSPLSFTIELA